MMKRLIALLLSLMLGLTCLLPALAEDDSVELEDEELQLEDDDEPAEAEPAAEAEASEDELAESGEVSEDEAYDEDFDESVYDEGDDGLEPLSDEELLAILAEDSDFVVLPEDFKFDDENVFTILLIGSDSYFADKRGRSDAVILVQLNAKAKTIKMASFMRDMYVTIPGKGKNRLNASYIWGGEKLLRRTLKANFGVEADAYCEVNFTRMIDVIDRIGGVDVEVSQEEMKQVNSILRFYNTKTGDRETDQLLNKYGPSTHLTGKQAMAFSRIRKNMGSGSGDSQRTGRQRKVLEAAFRKIVSLDLEEMTSLVLNNLDAVKTDLTMAQLVDLFPKAIVCRNATFSTMTVPYQGSYKNSMRNGMSVITLDFQRNQERLWEFFAVEDDD